MPKGRAVNAPIELKGRAENAQGLGSKCPCPAVFSVLGRAANAYLYRYIPGR